MKRLWLILFVIFFGCTTTTQNFPKPNPTVLERGNVRIKLSRMDEFVGQTNLTSKLDSLNNEKSKREREIKLIEDEIVKVQSAINQKKQHANILKNGKTIKINVDNAFFYLGDEEPTSKGKIGLRNGTKLKAYPIVARYSLGHCYRAEYRGRIGWIYKSYFNEWKSGLRVAAKDQIEKIIFTLREEERKSEELAKISRDEALAVAKISREKELSKFPAKFRRAIANNHIMIGMSREMVISSIGRPSSKNKDTYTSGTRTQMVYRRGEYDYVYLTNGIVTSFSENK